MPELGERLFRQLLAVASGQLSLGERNGTSQVTIWRNWPQSGFLVERRVEAGRGGEVLAVPASDGEPEVSVKVSPEIDDDDGAAYRGARWSVRRC